MRSPRYPGDAFLLADALTVEIRGYDLVWASPPCQAFTAYRRNPGAVFPRENLIPATRDRLEQLAGAWVMENVPGAPLRQDLLLCGSMFGLEVKRHRIFESSHAIAGPPCRHAAFGPPRFPHAWNRTNPRRTVEIGAWRVPLEVQRRAIGIDWMTLEEMSEAVPPAYARHIGEQLHPERGRR